MSQELEIYKEAIKVIDEDNRRSVHVTKDPGGYFTIELSQIFPRDITVSAPTLLQQCGLTLDEKNPFEHTGSTVYVLDGYRFSFHVEASIMPRDRVMLELVMNFALLGQPLLTEDFRTLNRVFNMFKQKLG